MKWLLARLAEPSTHSALAALLALGFHFIPPAYQPVAAAAAGVFGFAGIALPEKGTTTTTTTGTTNVQ